MVAPGNPLGLRAGRRGAPARPLRQPRPGHRHPRGAGRVAGAGRAGRQRPSTGYEHTEPSHAAVAQAVAAGAADVGLGIELAARAAQGLDFVPLVEERYHLVCLKSALEQPAIQALAPCCAPDWQQQMAALTGYESAKRRGAVPARGAAVVGVQRRAGPEARKNMVAPGRQKPETSGSSCARGWRTTRHAAPCGLPKQGSE